MYFVLVSSIVLNCILFGLSIWLWKSGKTSKPALDKDASQLLSDLLSGGAVAVVQVIDPSSMFLYSPKDIQ